MRLAVRRTCGSAGAPSLHSGACRSWYRPSLRLTSNEEQKMLVSLRLGGAVGMRSGGVRALFGCG